MLGEDRIGESLGKCGVNSDLGLLCVGGCAGWMTSQSPFQPERLSDPKRGQQKRERRQVRGKQND